MASWPPAQAGTVLLLRLVAFTMAVISRSRTNCSCLPAKKKTSPGRNREMKASSTWPSTAPRTKRTVTARSAVIVPMLRRCSRARAGAVTR